MTKMVFMNKKLIRNKKNAVVITLVVSIVVGMIINAGSWYQLLTQGDKNIVEQKDSRIGITNSIGKKIATLSIGEFDNKEEESNSGINQGYNVYDENYNIVGNFEEDNDESDINTIANVMSLELNDLTTKESVNVEEVSSKSKVLKASSTEVKYMASLVFAEAGGEPYKGKVAIANVVINRCKSKKFPNSVKKVITQRGQFGPYSNGQLNKAMKKYSKGYFTKPGYKYKNYRNSLSAVKKALKGYSTIGKRRYFNGKRYSRPRKNQKIIGNHRFW